MAAAQFSSIKDSSHECPALRRYVIPEAGRRFIELASRVGVYEDGLEAHIVSTLTERDRNALLFFRKNYPVELDQWLCGDEAMAGPPSTEYRAFSCLYFAADYLSQSRTKQARDGVGAPRAVAAPTAQPAGSVRQTASPLSPACPKCSQQTKRR